MGKNSRLLPETIFTRIEALVLAKLKLNTLSPADNPLSNLTTTRLLNAEMDLSSKVAERAAAKQAYNANTPSKNAAKQPCLVYTNHFIQVFNLAIARSIFQAADRALFQLPVDSDQLPEMSTESQLIIWAANVVNGESNRIAAGGVASTNPTGAEVEIKRQAFLTAFSTQSTLKDALDVKQEALEAILDETDKVIKKVWDELETFYNEETPESQRANCKEWGVVYVNVGTSKKMQGVITLEGVPAAGYVVRFALGRNKATSDAQGNYTLNTTLEGPLKVYVFRIDENGLEVRQWDFTATLPESGNLTANFNLIESEGQEV